MQVTRTKKKKQIFYPLSEPIQLLRPHSKCKLELESNSNEILLVNYRASSY